MSRNPFDPAFDELPASIPVFPLTGVLLLPRGKLPLNIFEPRYLNMVRDALAADRMIGMIQPSDPAATPPPLFATGCAGRITSFVETEDGRFLITLTGICRFTVAEELPTLRGYRRVVPDWSRFREDLEEGEGTATGLDRARLMAGLKEYFQRQGLSVDWAMVAKMPDGPLVASLCMICPFDPGEKQALLEAPDLSRRAETLMTLIEMALHTPPDGEAVRH